MARLITQRELRNESGQVMRAVDAGESFIVTRGGVAVGELKPIRSHAFVAREAVLSVFARAAHIDTKQFRADVDALLDQDPTPRA